MDFILSLVLLRISHQLISAEWTGFEGFHLRIAAAFDTKLYCPVIFAIVVVPDMSCLFVGAISRSLKRD